MRHPGAAALRQQDVDDDSGKRFRIVIGPLRRPRPVLLLILLIVELRVKGSSEEFFVFDTVLGELHVTSELTGGLR